MFKIEVGILDWSSFGVKECGEIKWWKKNVRALNFTFWYFIYGHR